MNPINSLRRFCQYTHDYGFRTAWGYIAVPYFEGVKGLPTKHKAIKNYLYRWSKQQGIDITSTSCPVQKSTLDSDNEEFPIWVCWLQGYDQMPEVVKLCYKSLNKNSPENGRVYLITKNNISDYVCIPEFIQDRLRNGLLSRTHFSDYLRIALLNRYGGLWIDASIFVSKPFELKLQKDQLFTIRLPKQSDTFVSDYRWTVSILGCVKGNILFAKLQQLMEQYIITHKEFIDFFLFDYFIAILYEHNDSIRNMIDSVDINNPEFYLLSKNINLIADEKNCGILFRQPFHKLSWKSAYYRGGTLYSKLLELNHCYSPETTAEIAVVMPAYNASAYIAESIHSILNQDFKDFELIITDDCSTDNTVEIVKSFDDPRIKLISTDMNTGAAKYPRELAIEAAHAPYICWIDSDDTVEPDYISALLKKKADTGADIVCSTMLAEEAGSLKYTLPRMGFDYGRVLTGREAVLLTLGNPWEINLNGWLCDRELWINVSTFKSLTVNHMDADDFSAREMLFNAGKVAFSTAAYHYRLHPQAITKKISTKTFERVITNRMVLEYFSSRWPEVVPVVTESLCRAMISQMRKFAIHEHLLPEDSRIRSRRLLKEYYSLIKKKEILSTPLSASHKFLLSLPFSLSLRMIRFINK